MTTKYFLSILILSFILSEITSYFYQTSIIKKKQFNVLRTIELQLQGKKIADEEWNKIKKAIDTNPDEWKSALVSKRSELASLKSSGALDGIVEGALDEDSVAQIDQIRLDIKAKSVTKSPLLRKRLLRSASKSTAVADEEVITEKETISEDEDEDDNDNDEEGEGDEDDLVLERLDDILDSYSEDDENSDDELVNIMTSDRKTFALLRSKYASTFIGSNVTAVGLYGFLNEVKDKKVHDTEFIENIVFSFSRLKVAKTAISAFKIYYKLWQEKLLIPQPENMRFGIDYANTCYVNNMEVAGDELRALLLADGHAVASDFVIGELCASIHNSVSASSASDSTSGNTKKNKKISAQDLAGPVKSQELVTKLQQLHTDLKQFSVAEVR